MPEAPTVVDMPRRESEAELVERHKRAVTESLRAVLEAMDAARQDGFKVAWSVGVDYAGRTCISGLSLYKEF